MVSRCGDCIHCGSVWKLRCELSGEDSRACSGLENKGSFAEGWKASADAFSPESEDDIHGH